MNRFDRIEKAVNTALEYVVTFFFFAMVVLVILLVTLRYVFGTTIIGGDEAVQFLFIYTTALGAAISLNKGDHIKISYFVDKLPAPAAKSTHIFGYILIILLHGYLLYLSIGWIKSVGYFESPVLQIPQGIVQVCIPVSCVIVVFFGIKHVFSTRFASNRRLGGDKK